MSDARIVELLEANNREVERRRAAEHDLDRVTRERDTALYAATRWREVAEKKPSIDDLAEYRRAAERLEAERSALREALRPFAGMWYVAEAERFAYIRFFLSNEHLHRASALCGDAQAIALPESCECCKGTGIVLPDADT